MALPDNVLSSEIISGPFLGGRASPVLAGVDYETGGKGFSDPSEGLEYQVWRTRISDDKTEVLVDAEEVAESVLYTGANISEVSLTFDQNMRPVLAFVENGLPRLRWYDTQAASQVVTDFPGIVTPRVSLDDKRAFASASSDVIFAYLSGGDLCYRQQRDRYEVEYNLGSAGGAPGLVKIGMNRVFRFQFLLANG